MIGEGGGGGVRYLTLQTKLTVVYALKTLDSGISTLV